MTSVSAVQSNPPVEEFLLPSKTPLSNKIKAARKEKVDTNFHTVRFKDMTIYRYEAKFIIQRDDKPEKNLAEGKANDVSANRRRLLLSQLFQQMLRANRDIFGENMKKIIYDGGVTIITLEKLNLKTDGVKEFNLNEQLIQENIRNYLPRKLTRLFCAIKYVGEIQVDSAKLKAEEINSDRSTLSSLELIIGQEMLLDDKFHVFPHVNYLRNPDDCKNIKGRVIKDGVAKSLRMGISAIDQKPSLLLQLSGTTSPFLPESSLLSYLLKFFNVRDVNDLANKLGNLREFKSMEKELKKVTLITTHMKHNRIFVCDGISSEEFDKISFSKSEEPESSEHGPSSKNRKVSCVEYFEEKYRTTLKCKRLPAVVQIVRKNGTKLHNYYPIDVVNIMDGIRVPIEKMDAAFQKDFIPIARKPPNVLRASINKLDNAAHLSKSNLYAKKFNMDIVPNVVQTEAEVLFQPAIQYQNCDFELWPRNERRKFLINGKTDRFLFINYKQCLNNKDANYFVGMYKGKLQERGTTIKESNVVSVYKDFEIDQKAKDYRATFVMVATRDKLDPIHHYLKNFEIESKIITQHVSIRTVSNASKAVTLENLMMKTNEKMGGTNFTAKTSIKFKKAHQGVLPQNVVENEWIGQRMFIGIDITRGTPTIATRQGIPSVVGIAYSYNDRLSLAAHTYYQLPGSILGHGANVDVKFVNYVQDLDQHLPPLIEDYKNRSAGQKWPKQLVIYRSGVSEGEYKTLVQYEKAAIKKAIEQLRDKHKINDPIGFTILISQKNNTRLMTPNASNVNAGTLVFKDIVSPVVDQFILVAQTGRIGTSRPITYTVLADELPDKKRSDLKELANLTNTLCYLHCGVLGSVTLPSVLHHAQEISKRGRNNMRFRFFGSADDAASHSSGGTQRNVDPTAQNCQKLSQQLKFSSNIKFWS